VTEHIGFIGLGAMGNPISRRLLAAGFALTVYARRPEATEPLVALGAVACGSPAEVAGASDIVFTMVTNTADVEQVVLGPGGIVHGAQRGSMVIDMSTISPLAVRGMVDALGRRGVAMLDAPVSGGPGGATAGSLAIMVGGTAEAYARALPVFGHFGQSIVHVGASGAGQVAKACNQLALCVAMEGVAEALALARRMDVDPGRVREALLGGFAASRVLDVFGGRMVTGDFVAGVESRLHHKDLQIVLDLAHGLGLPVPAAAATTQTFNALIGRGGGRLDSAAILRVIEGTPDS
jgi:3-hydroxyisobutyrate dehydrogenase-like beta-hydroxyacid dehydrogenase